MNGACRSLDVKTNWMCCILSTNARVYNWRNVRGHGTAYACFFHETWRTVSVNRMTTRYDTYTTSTQRPLADRQTQLIIGCSMCRHLTVKMSTWCHRFTCLHLSHPVTSSQSPYPLAIAHVTHPSWSVTGPKRPQLSQRFMTTHITGIASINPLKPTVAIWVQL